MYRTIHRSILLKHFMSLDLRFVRFDSLQKKNEERYHRSQGQNRDRDLPVKPENYAVVEELSLV